MKKKSALTWNERCVIERFGTTGDEVVADVERILALDDDDEIRRVLVEKGYAKTIEE